MALPTKDTSILMQHLIALKAKRELLAEKVNGLQEQLFEMDSDIQAGVDVLLQANIEEDEPEVEVVRQIKR